MRAPDGSVEIDPRGRAPGRGAYLHRDPVCLDAALRRGGLARALRTGLSPEEAVRLRAGVEREVER
ncbi:MAG: YlxR family protein [Candidatus Velamenicoccus archaeovorus]